MSLHKVSVLTPSAVVLAVLACAINVINGQPDSLETFRDGAPTGASFDKFHSLFVGEGTVDPFINTFLTRNTSADGADPVNGVLFVPSDEAFTAFAAALKLPGELAEYPELMQKVVHDHVITSMGSGIGEAFVEGTSEVLQFMPYMGDSDGRDILNVTFSSDGQITEVAPRVLAPPTISGTASALGTYGPVANGNGTIVFVDKVIFTQGTWENQLKRAASSFYAAVEKYADKTGGELSTFKALLNFDGQSELKDMLTNMDLQANGTLFAPENAAIEDFVGALGGGTTAADLDSYIGLRELTNSILKYHYIPADLPKNFDDQEVETALGPRLTLYDVGDDEYVGYMSNSVNASVVDKGAMDITDDGLIDGRDVGELHTVSAVLNPLANPLNLAGFQGSSALQGQTFNSYSQAISLVSELNKAVNGPALRGAAFAPSDAAFESFIADMGVEGFTANSLLGNIDLLSQVLYEHTILDGLLNGTSETYKTMASEEMGINSMELSITTNSSSMMPESYSAGEASATVLAASEQNANGGNAELLHGNARGNGRVYMTDKVVVSQATRDRVGNLASPADGKWKEDAPGGSESYSTVESLLPNEIQDLFGGSANFTGFMPSNEAFSSLASGVFEVELSNLESALESNRDVVLEMLNSYFVMGESDLNLDAPYDTRNPDVTLTKTASGISLADKNTGRKLMSAHTGTIAGNPKKFFNGQTLYYMNEAPVTPTQQDRISGAIDNSAAAAAPTFIALLVGTVTAIALLGL